MAILTMNGYVLSMGGSALATADPTTNFTARLKSLVDSDFAMAAVITDDNSTELYNSNGYTTGKITDLKLYGAPPFVVSFSASSGPYKLLKQPEASSVYGDVIDMSSNWTTLNPQIPGGVWSASITAGTGEMNFHVQTGYKAISWTGSSSPSFSTFYSSKLQEIGQPDKYLWQLREDFKATAATLSFLSGVSLSAVPVPQQLDDTVYTATTALSGVLTDLTRRVRPYVEFPLPIRDTLYASGKVRIAASSNMSYVGNYRLGPYVSAAPTRSVSISSSSPTVGLEASGYSYKLSQLLPDPSLVSAYHSGVCVEMYSKPLTTPYASSVCSSMYVDAQYVTGVHCPIK